MIIIVLKLVHARIVFKEIYSSFKSELPVAAGAIADHVAFHSNVSAESLEPQPLGDGGTNVIPILMIIIGAFGTFSNGFAVVVLYIRWRNRPTNMFHLLLLVLAVADLLVNWGTSILYGLPHVFPDFYR